MVAFGNSHDIAASVDRSERDTAPSSALLFLTSADSGA
jgi:hypothetical protein